MGQRVHSMCHDLIFALALAAPLAACDDSSSADAGVGHDGTVAGSGGATGAATGGRSGAGGGSTGQPGTGGAVVGTGGRSGVGGGSGGRSGPAPFSSDYTLDMNLDARFPPTGQSR
jgi:hypothetical protein